MRAEPSSPPSFPMVPLDCVRAMVMGDRKAYSINDFTTALSASLPANCAFWRTALLIQSGSNLENIHSCLLVLCEIGIYSKM